MDPLETSQKDPYDEAEAKVRKHIRKAIVLQSQLNTENRDSSSNVESTAKRTELQTICSRIESDIGELQKVIQAIENNPKRYKISKSLLESRKETIEEFKSKVKGIKSIGNAYGGRPGTSYSKDYSQAQLQYQQDVISQQDMHIDQLHGSAYNLHTQAMAVNAEIKSQNRLINDIESGMEDTQLQIGTLGKKLARYLDTNNPSLLRLILILCAIASALVVVLLIF
ncbi:conserved hypothetical protein [Theileria equi strain WA]|uniref:t-SNARE coiled-coil homology domain-containing protein n=1 Tax=Theileria equi strain WA TaxID=1537102 RepID=L1LF16_THEEQ|nr:conserved hypothetical protein [Theileria equi strain WA]EKX73946.1 conserved hypothetical protein [Theileria equi strain WA]|eukprot:XP_004833398.1 conserved hypothetical protein [Theileria equi strain WA]